MATEIRADFCRCYPSASPIDCQRIEVMGIKFERGGDPYRYSCRHEEAGALNVRAKRNIGKSAAASASE